VSWSEAAVSVKISSLTGARLDGVNAENSVRFDFNVRLDEKERRNGRIAVLFGLSIKTKPNVVKYEVEGTATLTGKDAAVEELLKNDPKNNVPYVFHRIYQQVFTPIFLLASTLGTIYPPPDLLATNESIPVKDLGGSLQVQAAGSPEAEVPPVEVTTPPPQK
jgi:hypothetical protein